ncbi:hypothetical protein WOLCODRAFT_163454 [Wolfiporia cocos MD-104 SS10]|uniref:Uncharacterized protein n=1 Tax=Wolfiporia cocos (strain MD-104) TaxID=742152 RepID=A0A2H3JVY4_WOLCO|nr:hypothetical protein WOLCODRAFT_163454 [Wolfiporia cocos MD-104 SS10]
MSAASKVGAGMWSGGVAGSVWYCDTGLLQSLQAPPSAARPDSPPFRSMSASSARRSLRRPPPPCPLSICPRFILQLAFSSTSLILAFAIDVLPSTSTSLIRVVGSAGPPASRREHRSGTADGPVPGGAVPSSSATPV